MNNLEFTPEFEEAKAAISNDILKNPPEYEAAGKWLNERKNHKWICSTIETRSKAIIQSNFKRVPPKEWLKAIKASDTYISPDISSREDSARIEMPDSVLEICKILQAVAVVDMGFFPDMEDLIKKYQENANLIPIGYKSMHEGLAKRDEILRFIKRHLYACYEDLKGLVCEHYALFLTCEELLKTADSLKLLDREKRIRVRLVAWLVAEPDADTGKKKITKFQDIPWDLDFQNKPIPQRANILRELNANEIFEKWQALVCKAATGLMKTADTKEEKEGDVQTSTKTHEERSKPMSKSKMMAAIGIDSYKTFNVFAKQHGIQEAGNRQTFSIRLDSMDKKTRSKLEKA